MTGALDIAGILQHLPHRYPLLLIDRVLELVPGERILALKNVTINEPFFPGHFPHHPVMPGVMILESLAQTAAILAFKTLNLNMDDKNIVLFAGVDGGRFKRQVIPGDQLKLEVKPIRHKGGIWKFAAQASVDGQIACEAELMCTYRQIEK
jgi:3-hydroxyacyl-[acyl-carrier-protein] dehydratase